MLEIVVGAMLIVGLLGYTSIRLEDAKERSENTPNHACENRETYFIEPTDDNSD